MYSTKNLEVPHLLSNGLSQIDLYFKNWKSAPVTTSWVNPGLKYDLNQGMVVQLPCLRRQRV